MSNVKYQGSTFTSKGAFMKLGSIIEYLHDNIDLALYNIRIVSDPYSRHTRIEIWPHTPSTAPVKYWDLYPDKRQQIEIPTWLLKPPEILNRIPYYHY